MKKVTDQVCRAFNERQKLTVGNSMTDDGIEVTNAGWPTVTTRERLNGLIGVRVHQKGGKQYLNGNEWDGSWTLISRDK